jgi:hypothetical protein
LETLVLSTFDCLIQHSLDLTISNVKQGYSYKNYYVNFYSAVIQLKKTLPHLRRVDDYSKSS